MLRKIPGTRLISIRNRFICGCSLAVLLAPLAVLAAPKAVDLGTAGGFAILTKSGISTVPSSAVTGDLGVSPIDSTAITGFSMTLDSSGQFATSIQVTGKIYGPNYGSPTPANLRTAVGDMETAYTDAAGRTLPDHTELGSGSIGGMTLAPGLYKWSSGVTIASGVVLSGGPNAVWIFQIAGNLTLASATAVTLSGGAQVRNIFWQVAGGVGVDLGTTSAFQGTVLSAAGINLQNGASVNGRLLAQTAVTLDSNTITVPPFQEPPTFGSIQHSQNGSVTLAITNTPGVMLTIQTSTNLINWTLLSTVTPTNSPYIITNTPPKGDVAFFYRAFYQ